MAASSKKVSIAVEVISDTVCPWCFIGKRRLEKAMARFADRAEFTVRWLPFQLVPDMSKEGVDKLDYYNKRFGAQRVAQMMPSMARTFQEEGLEYKLGGLTGNTFDSHRLIAWAEKFGPVAQNAVVEQLFLSYFTQEKFIGDRGVLLEAATKAGLPADQAAALLDDPQAMAAEVKAGLVRGRGVGGVPFFTVDKTYKMSGAQPPELFEELFDQICSSKGA